MSPLILPHSGQRSDEPRRSYPQFGHSPAALRLLASARRAHLLYRRTSQTTRRIKTGTVSFGNALTRIAETQTTNVTSATDVLHKL